MAELGNVYALESLDGVGKTTAGKLLAAQTGSIYLYCMDGNPLRPYRRFFDTLPTPLRFIYYLGVSIGTHANAQRIRSTADVYIDRSIASTIAYHKAYGLSDAWLNLIPRALMDQIDLMFYFTVNEEIRRQRILDRASREKVLTLSDRKSFLFGDIIDYEYRRIFPAKTLIIPTDGKTPPQVVREATERLYERAK